MKTYTKKHMLAIIAVVALCILALLLWGTAKNKKSMPMSGPAVSTSGDTSLQTYIASDNSFLFQMPADFHSSDLAGDDGSETMLFVGNNTDRNFQIYISSYASTDPLTAATIKQSIPSIVMNDPETIAVDGAQGVAFVSSSQGSAQTRQIWFTHNGSLYQITTYEDFDQEMVNILSTWKWQ